MTITFQLVIEIVLAVLLLCSLLAVLHIAKRSVIKPLPKPDGTELFTVIAASGRAGQLEQTVKGLLWLNENGEILSRVVIADCGLESRTRKLAKLLAGDCESVSICSPRELPAVLEEFGWTEDRNT